MAGKQRICVKRLFFEVKEGSTSRILVYRGVIAFLYSLADHSWCHFTIAELTSVIRLFQDLMVTVSDCGDLLSAVLFGGLF